MPYVIAAFIVSCLFEKSSLTDRALFEPTSHILCYNGSMPDFTDEDLRKAVENNISIAGVLRTLNRAYVGTNYRLIRRKIGRLGLDTSHFKGRAHGTTTQDPIPWSTILVVNSPHKIGTQRKRRLIAEDILKNKCYLCNSHPVWQGKPLVLELDHENGINNDNRLENLRLLCPNCHSQTITYCGRNLKVYGNKKPCPICHKPILIRSRTCQQCSQSLIVRETKIVWPSVEEILKLLKTLPMTRIAIKLGVTDHAIRKFLRNHGKMTAQEICQLRPRGRVVDGDRL